MYDEAPTVVNKVGCTSYSVERNLELSHALNFPNVDNFRRDS